MHVYLRMGCLTQIVDIYISIHINTYMYVYLKNKKHVYVFICVYVHLRAISQGLDYEGHWTVAYQRK